jgi:hypothetical protein
MDRTVGQKLITVASNYRNLPIKSVTVPFSDRSLASNLISGSIDSVSGAIDLISVASKSAGVPMISISGAMNSVSGDQFSGNGP